MGARAYIHVPLLALSATAGAVDAATFLGLHQVFTANQTGNTALLGIAIGAGDGPAIARTGISLPAFMAGVMLGAAVLRKLPLGWHRRVRGVLVAEAAILALVAALWGPLGTLSLIAVLSVAMGMQSAAAVHVGVPGITTTFITGTMTRLATQLVDRRERDHPEAAPPLTWAAYLAGAIVGGLVSRWTSDALTVAIASLIVVLSALPSHAAARRSHPTP